MVTSLGGVRSAVSYWRVRILVTNDDGVHAPGLAAIARALATWSAAASDGEERDVVVVAPLINFSGASAAVGTVYERDAIDYRRVVIEGAEALPTFGIDGSPALSTIVGILGGFGPTPDLVVSGVNLGINVGRSVLHSGTVGAALTASQMGVRGLALSIRSIKGPIPWTTATTCAVQLLPTMAAAPPGTVLNLNVPAVELDELRGVRRGRVSRIGLIKAATTEGGPFTRPDVAPGHEGKVALVLGAAVPELGAVDDGDPSDDAALVAEGYASLTPLVSVRADERPDTEEIVQRALTSLQPLLTPR